MDSPWVLTRRLPGEAPVKLTSATFLGRPSTTETVTCPATGLTAGRIAIDAGHWRGDVRSHTFIHVAEGGILLHGAVECAIHAGQGVVLPAGAAIEATASRVRGWVATYPDVATAATPSSPIVVRDVAVEALAPADLSSAMASDGPAAMEFTHTYFTSADGLFSVQVWSSGPVSYAAQRWPSSELVCVVAGRVECRSAATEAVGLEPDDAAVFLYGSRLGWRQDAPVKLILARAVPGSAV